VNRRFAFTQNVQETAEMLPEISRTESRFRKLGPVFGAWRRAPGNARTYDAGEDARHFSESEPRTRLSDSHASAGIYLPLSADRAAGLRDTRDRDGSGSTCVELKGLKLYIWSFRDEGCFHEAVTNRILDDLVAAIQPRFIRVTARWYVRGGIFTNVVVEHRKEGWEPAPRVDLAQFEPGSNTR